MRSIHRNPHTDVISKKSPPLLRAAPSLCYLAHLGRAEVPAFLHLSLEKRLGQKSGNHSQRRLVTAAISHDLELVFSAQATVYRSIATGLRLWILFSYKETLNLPLKEEEASHSEVWSESLTLASRWDSSGLRGFRPVHAPLRHREL